MVEKNVEDSFLNSFLKSCGFCYHRRVLNASRGKSWFLGKGADVLRKIIFCEFWVRFSFLDTVFCGREECIGFFFNFFF